MTFFYNHKTAWSFLSTPHQQQYNFIVISPTKISGICFRAKGNFLYLVMNKKWAGCTITSWQAHYTYYSCFSLHGRIIWTQISGNFFSFIEPLDVMDVNNKIWKDIVVLKTTEIMIGKFSNHWWNRVCFTTILISNISSCWTFIIL